MHVKATSMLVITSGQMCRHCRQHDCIGGDGDVDVTQITFTAAEEHIWRLFTCRDTLRTIITLGRVQPAAFEDHAGNARCAAAVVPQCIAVRAFAGLRCGTCIHWNVTLTDAKMAVVLTVKFTPVCPRNI